MNGTVAGAARVARPRGLKPEASMKTRLIACVVALLAGIAYGQEPKGPPADGPVDGLKPSPFDQDAQGRETGRSAGGRARLPEGAWRQKWEYSVLSDGDIRKRADGDLNAALNKLGEEGWEL